MCRHAILKSSDRIIVVNSLNDNSVHYSITISVMCDWKTLAMHIAIIFRTYDIIAMHVAISRDLCMWHRSDAYIASYCYTELRRMIWYMRKLYLQSVAGSDRNKQ